MRDAKTAGRSERAAVSSSANDACVRPMASMKSAVQARRTAAHHRSRSSAPSAGWIAGRSRTSESWYGLDWAWGIVPAPRATAYPPNHDSIRARALGELLADQREVLGVEGTRLAPQHDDRVAGQPEPGDAGHEARHLAAAAPASALAR